MSDAGQPPTDGDSDPAPDHATDGARLVALVAWNVRARRAAEGAMIGPPGVTPLDAARCNRHAEEVWRALVREAHGTPVTHVHVHQFYNRVLLSLRRAPADPDAWAAPARLPGPRADDEEVTGAFAGPGARAGGLAVPLELTRAFFGRLRRRERPWRDEGDEKFHRYLARSAKWLAVAHKRDVGLLPRRSRAGAPARPDTRRVHDALLDALVAPRVLGAVANAPWLAAGARDVFGRQAAALVAHADVAHGAARPVPAVALRSALAEALDRLAADAGYVPTFEPPVEALVGPLLRSRGAWGRAWTAWCAGLDAAVLRDLAAWHLAGAVVPAPPTPDPRLAALTATQLAAAAPTICEAVLPAVLARLVAVFPEIHTTAAALGDPLTSAIAADARSGLTGAQIAVRRGITPALVYKRLERLRRQVAAHLVRTLPGLHLAADSRPPAGPSDD